jgi:hypothetical protein
MWSSHERNAEVTCFVFVLGITERHKTYRQTKTEVLNKGCHWAKVFAFALPEKSRKDCSDPLSLDIRMRLRWEL